MLQTDRLLSTSFGRFALGFKKLSRFLGPIDHSTVRLIRPDTIMVVIALVALRAQVGHADPGPAANLAAANPNSLHIAIGPTMAGIRLEGDWDTAFGGELHVVRLSRNGTIGAIGAAFGATSFASSDATRLYLDGYLGIRVSDDWTAGIAVAPIVDLFPTHRALAGVRVTTWLHAGIAPFIAASRRWGLGTKGTLDIAFGLRIPFSIVQF